MIGKSIYLRPVEEKDIDKIVFFMNQTEIGEIMNILPKSLMAHKEWYSKIQNDPTKFVFAICRKDNNDYIGNVAVTSIDYINSHGMFSIFLANKDNRSKGIGTEATKLMLEFIYGRLNLNKVYLKCSPEYIEATKMYHKLGFKQDGILRSHEYKGGKYHDKLLFSLLVEEYYEDKSDR
jgi:diamine N-acetyltransferase